MSKPNDANRYTRSITCACGSQFEVKSQGGVAKGACPVCGLEYSVNMPPGWREKMNSMETKQPKKSKGDK